MQGCVRHLLFDMLDKLADVRSIGSGRLGRILRTERDVMKEVIGSGAKYVCTRLRRS